MSYEIFYDKRFITVGDNRIIPIFQHGSNNCFEYSWSGRTISEKNWSVVNYPFTERYVFSKEEIIKMSKEVAKDGMYKSRNRAMTNDEIKRYYINGYKAAQTLEFYLELGNNFELRDISDWNNPIRYNPKTTDELVKLIEELDSEDKRISMGFTNREFKTPKRTRIIRKKQRKEQGYYYILNNSGMYFLSLRKYGYAYTYYPGSAKSFISEKEVINYLEKYKNRLRDFEIEKIDEPYAYYA